MKVIPFNKLRPQRIEMDNRRKFIPIKSFWKSVEHSPNRKVQKMKADGFLDIARKRQKSGKEGGKRVEPGVGDFARGVIHVREERNSPVAGETFWATLARVLSIGSKF